MQKQRGNQSTAETKVPSFSYLIDHVVLFEYQGMQHLMVAFENKSVQIFDFESGMSLFEF